MESKSVSSGVRFLGSLPGPRVRVATRPRNARRRVRLPAGAPNERDFARGATSSSTRCFDIRIARRNCRGAARTGPQLFGSVANVGFASVSYTEGRPFDSDRIHPCLEPRTPSISGECGALLKRKRKVRFLRGSPRPVSIRRWRRSATPVVHGVRLPGGTPFPSLRSSSGEDTALSRPQRGFDSRTERPQKDSLPVAQSEEHPVRSRKVVRATRTWQTNSRIVIQWQDGRQITGQRTFDSSRSDHAVKVLADARRSATPEARAQLPLTAPSHGALGVVACTSPCDGESVGSIPTGHPSSGDGCDWRRSSPV